MSHMRYSKTEGKTLTLKFLQNIFLEIIIARTYEFSLKKHIFTEIFVKPFWIRVRSVEKIWPKIISQ